MAKDKINEKQLDIFYEEPKIVGLGIADVKIKNGEISATLIGMTNTTDLAQFNNEIWCNGLAQWLVELCGNRGDVIDGVICDARQKAFELETERELQRAAMDAAAQSNVHRLLGNSGGSVSLA